MSTTMSSINLNVEEFTSPNLVLAEETESLKSLEEKMKSNNIRHIPVVKNKKLTGIVSLRDLYTSDKDNLEKLTAKDRMTEKPFFVSREDKIQDVAFEMSNRKIGSAIVEDHDGTVFGIFTTTDALNALVEVVSGIHANK